MPINRKTPGHASGGPSEGQCLPAFSPGQRQADQPHTSTAKGALQLLQVLEGVTKVGAENWTALCPCHEDTAPSLRVDIRPNSLGHRTTFVRCVTCGANGDTVIEAKGLWAERQHIYYGNPARVVRPKRIEPLSESKVVRYVDYLHESPNLLDYLHDERGLYDDTLRSYEVGYDEQRDRYTLPVRHKRKLVNIRRYLPHAPPGVPKMINASGHGSPARLYPYLPSQRSRRGILICEGEWDCLLLRQHGFLAFTGTHGAGTWRECWAHLLAGRTVALVYDVGATSAALAAAETLVGTCASVRVVGLPMPRKGDDVTDWFVTYQRRADELRQLIRSVAPLGREGKGPR
jgi:hypothetical protein